MDKSLKEEVMARLVDRMWPDAVLAFYKEAPNPAALILQPGDNIRLELAGVSVLIQNTSQHEIYIRGEA